MVVILALLTLLPQKVASVKIAQGMGTALVEQDLLLAIIVTVLRNAVGVMGMATTIKQGTLYNVVDAMAKRNALTAMVLANVLLAEGAAKHDDKMNRI